MKNLPAMGGAGVYLITLRKGFYITKCALVLKDPPYLLMGHGLIYVV